MTVSNQDREKLHMAMTADGNSRFRERDGSLGLLVRVDNENEVDGLVSGSFDWSGTEDADQTDLRASMTVSNKQRERLHMAMTADGDSQDEAMAGSLGLALRVDADEKFDGLVSGGLDWSDALEARMTVSNDREKLHMAMTADGNSRFRERDGSLGLLVRVDNENEVDGLVSGSFDWSGTEDADQTDLQASMTVINKQRERLAHGDDRRRRLCGKQGQAGSLGLALRVDADEKFDGLVSGGLDWSDALEARMTVSNQDREKLHMAMTADGNSRFREEGRSLGLLVRVDNETKSTALCRALRLERHGGRGSDGPTGQHDGHQPEPREAAHGDDRRRRLARTRLGWLARARAARRRDEKFDATCVGAASTGAARGGRASMTVINKQRERLHMAMTADGDSQDEAMAGSLGLLVRGR